jgi:uncharacterized membrane protein YuzA (DUF378 family)
MDMSNRTKVTLIYLIVGLAALYWLQQSVNTQQRWSGPRACSPSGSSR